MKTLDCFQVDAFTRQPFAGNPACVCPLDSWLPDGLLRAVARENAVPASAFYVRRGDHFEIRWFSPASEIELCGHGTLAAGFVLMTEHEPSRTHVRFHAGKIRLEVEKSAGGLTLDLPALPPAPATAPAGLADALGLGTALETWAADGRQLFLLARAEQVRALRPDFSALQKLPDFGSVIVSAPGTGADSDVHFVSRYFAPHHGANEDPVTGSAHCVLAPYWSAKLERTALRARQVSERGGELDCEVRGERVLLTGHAVLVKRGILLLPDPAAAAASKKT